MGAGAEVLGGVRRRLGRGIAEEAERCSGAVLGVEVGGGEEFSDVQPYAEQMEDAVAQGATRGSEET